MRNNYLFNTIFNRKLLFLLLIITFFSQNLVAQKAKQDIGIEISLEADEKIVTEQKNNMRVNKETQIPIALYD